MCVYIYIYNLWTIQHNTILYSTTYSTYIQSMCIYIYMFIYVYIYIYIYTESGVRDSQAHREFSGKFESSNVSRVQC